jgi:hypothetical protein
VIFHYAGLQFPANPHRQFIVPPTGMILLFTSTDCGNIFVVNPLSHPGLFLIPPVAPAMKKIRIVEALRRGPAF